MKKWFKKPLLRLDYKMIPAGLAILAVTLIGILALTGCGGGDDPAPTTPTGPSSAADYTVRGWTRFEAGDYSGAQNDFSQAINRDGTYAEAHTGLGWVRLVQSVSTTSMLSAATSFSNAMTRGENQAYVQGGRAAANLAIGGASLGSASSDAQAALAANSSFVFSHLPSFNPTDLGLIDSFAHAAMGDFSEALIAADLVLDSGIEEGDSVTWEVDGTSFDSFTGAVLAHLHKISEQFSG